MNIQEMNQRLDRFKIKHTELQDLLRSLGKNQTDEPRWALTQSVEELEKDVSESIRQGISRLNQLKQIAEQFKNESKATNKKMEAEIHLAQKCSMGCRKSQKKENAD